jgi:hypothetical protein
VAAIRGFRIKTPRYFDFQDPYPKGDQLVISALADELLTPGRIEGQIGRLLEAILDGTVPDRTLVRNKMAELDIRREECVALLKALDSHLREIRQALSKQQAKAVAADLKRRLLEAPRALQKRYVYGLVRNRCEPGKCRRFRTKRCCNRCRLGSRSGY